MLGSFWEGVGGRLADRWASVAGPALVFWLAGLLLLARRYDGLQQLSRLSDWLDRQPVVTQLLVLLGALVVVLASGVLVDRLVFPTLRALEGYWPRWLSPLRRRLVERARLRAEAEDDALQQLASVVLAQPASAGAEQISAFTRLDHRRRRRPGDPRQCMPTRIGNVLRAAETRPVEKYGLDAVVVWPRLWLLLPDLSRSELQAARARLDAAVAAVVWGLLLCAFGPWTPVAVPVGLVVAATAVALWVPARAETFADLLEAVYDLHRTALYEQLRWPLPSSPQHEQVLGAQLTGYLWRGSDDPRPTFT